MVEILVCKCESCTHWEIVKDNDGNIHLLCKTCGRTDEVILTISDYQPAHWQAMESE